MSIPQKRKEGKESLQNERNITRNANIKKLLLINLYSDFDSFSYSKLQFDEIKCNIQPM
jgi:hypothetical protein